MNRRAALAALVSMPEVVRISAAPVRPKDVIVIETDEWLTSAHIERVLAMLQPIWPDQKIVVLSAGMKLKVVAGVEA